MTTRRKTSDLGQSYLDLLSNGLGAVIILFMILVGVRAPTPFSSDRSHRESSYGRVVTYRGLTPDLERKVGDKYVVQLVVLATTDPAIRPEVVASGSAPDTSQLFRGPIVESRSNWLILRDRGRGSPWSIRLRGAAPGTRVIVYASLGSAVLEPQLASTGSDGKLVCIHDGPDQAISMTRCG